MIFIRDPELVNNNYIAGTIMLSDKRLYTCNGVYATDTPPIHLLRTVCKLVTRIRQACTFNTSGITTVSISSLLEWMWGLCMCELGRGQPPSRLSTSALPPRLQGTPRAI